MDTQQKLQKTAKHWSAEAGKNAEEKLKNWRSIPSILRELNRRVYGLPIEGVSSGIQSRLRDLNLNLRVGVSVGSGRGLKEMALIQNGLVRHFTCYEISTAFIEQGVVIANDRGLQDKINFTTDDYREHQESSVNLVHWNGSLHHMLDVESAVNWSYKVLKPGGIFYMDDYIGPNRFQWTVTAIERINLIRSALPEAFFLSERKDNRVGRAVVRPNAARIIEVDPTEAADSESIVPSIIRNFPNAQFYFQGCTIMPYVINGIAHNFHGGKNSELLSLIMLIDEISMKDIGSNFACCLGVKH